MLRNAGLAHLAGVGARTVQESATGAAGAIDQFLGEDLVVVAVVVLGVADRVDQARPSAAQSDDAVALAQRP